MYLKGIINEDEVAHIAKKRGQNIDLREYDQDGDGKISYQGD